MYSNHQHKHLFYTGESFDFISKSLCYYDETKNKQITVHCVKSTEFDKESSIIYTGHDKNIIDLITNQGKPFVISKDDVFKFEKKRLGTEMYKWHLKLISNVFAYSNENIKLLGYDNEVEKLIFLVSIL